MKENQTDERFDSSPMDEIGRNDERDLRSSKHTYRVPLAIPRKAGSGEGILWFVHSPTRFRGQQ